MEERDARRRRGGGNSLHITVIVALMLLAVILGLSVFFKVSRIEVEGVSMYSPDEVVEVSGLETGQSMFFLGESSSAVKIKNALAYVDEVRISRKMPDTVTITVTESYPIAAVEYAGSLWIIDKNAKILEKTDVSKKPGHIEILGIEPIMPAVGDTLSLGESGAVQLTYLKAVLSGLTDADIYREVSWLDVTNVSAVTFFYDNRFTVNMGKGEFVSDKLWLLGKMIEQHPGREKASIDLTEVNEEVKKGHYIGK